MTMFDDILMEISAREFEAKVKRLFELNQRSGKTVCEIPFLGTKYSTDSEDDYAELQRRTSTRCWRANGLLGLDRTAPVSCRFARKISRRWRRTRIPSSGWSVYIAARCTG
jgi:hypothetical protein